MATSFTPVDLNDSGNVTRTNREGDSGWLWPPTGDGPNDTVLDVLPSGDCTFWGIPFNVGSGRFVMVAADNADGVPEQATIPVGQAARRILFAHVCAPVAGQRASIEGAGATIGTYRIMFSDQTTEEQVLRRRFEIHDVSIPWGHHPFLSRNCSQFGPLPADAHPAGVTSDGSTLSGWWLYDWESPHPDKIIERIEITAASPAAIAVGAITLCDEETDPLAWPPRAEVAVTVAQEQGDGQEVTPAARDNRSALEVEMNRGVVARQDSLLVPQEDYLTTQEAGWGRGGQEERDGYLEIHGSSEGVLTVRAENQNARFRWGDVLEKKRVQSGSVRLEIIAPNGRQWVHVRVEDGDTGRPVGCRVHFRTPHGAYVAPHGHHADIRTAWLEGEGGDCTVRNTPYAYIDGSCQIDLPIGHIFVEAVRGFEYLPLRHQLEIKPGQRHVTLKIQRSFDMKKRGYYSGDTHVHYLSAQSSHLEAVAEDVNVVHLLASQWGRMFTSWGEFTGGLSPTSSDEHMVWVSQENRQHILGHVSLLGLRNMVAPMCTGGPEEDWVGGAIQTLMADWAEACRSQNGLVIMPHMPVPDFENAANIVMGHADAAEMCWIWLGEEIGAGERGYYRWLNVGQKIPIVGGTDKMSNGRVLAGSRTYAKLLPDEEFTFDNWCQAVRRGTTFASTGAMIDLTVEGRQMGEEMSLPGNGGTVEVEATASSIWPLSGLELVVNGVQVTRETVEDEREIRIRFTLKTERSCWVVARCWGPHMTDAGPVMAHSSPIYIDVGKQCAFEPTDGQYLLTHMEGGISWAERIGVFREEAVRSRLIALFREAQEELRRRCH